MDLQQSVSWQPKILLLKQTDLISCLQMHRPLLLQLLYPQHPQLLCHLQ